MNLPTPQLPSFDPATFTIEAMGSATIQAAVAIFIAFVFITLIAISRRYLSHSSMQGVWSGVVIGITLVVLLEIGFVWGTKELLGPEKAHVVPEDFRLALGSGQKQLVQVLGAETEASQPTAQSVVLDFEYLSQLDSELVKNSICKDESVKNGTIK